MFSTFVDFSVSFLPHLLQEIVQLRNDWLNLRERHRPVDLLDDLPNAFPLLENVHQAAVFDLHPQLVLVLLQQVQF